MKFLLLGLLVLAIGFLVLSRKNLAIPYGLGVKNGKFAECPSSPNCVSSQAGNEVHFIPPIKYRGEDPIRALKEVLGKKFKFEVVDEKENYLHIVCISPVMRFRDDVEFWARPEKGLIEVRSASRIGYSDFGVNRNRIELIRQALIDINKL